MTGFLWSGELPKTSVLKKVFLSCTFQKKKSSERLNVRTNGQIGSKRTNIVVRFTEIYKWFYTYMAVHDTTQLIFAIIDVNDRWQVIKMLHSHAHASKQWPTINIVESNWISVFQHTTSGGLDFTSCLCWSSCCPRFYYFLSFRCQLTIYTNMKNTTLSE